MKKFTSYFYKALLLVIGFVFTQNLLTIGGLEAYSIPVFLFTLGTSVFYSKRGLAFDLVTPSQLAFNGEEVRDFAEAIILGLKDNPALNTFHTIVENVVAKKQIAYLGSLSKITKKDAGCGTGAMSQGIQMSNKFWDPEQTKIWIKECHTQFDDMFTVYMKKKGKDYADFTGTPIADFIYDLMENAAIEDAYRIAWFNDKVAANVSGGGVIENGVSLTDYNIIDGFWKQIFAIVAADSSRRVTINENASATKELQDTLGATTAKDVYAKLLRTASPDLRRASDKVIITTRSLSDNYMDFLESKDVDASFDKIENGFDIIRRRGVEIITFDFWDETIRADFDNGTKWSNPHRALLTTKSNLQLGFDTSSAVGDFDVFFDKMSETVNLKGGYKIDAKIVVDNLIQVAY